MKPDQRTKRPAILPHPFEGTCLSGAIDASKANQCHIPSSDMATKTSRYKPSRDSSLACCNCSRCRAYHICRSASPTVREAPRVRFTAVGNGCGSPKEKALSQLRVENLAMSTRWRTLNKLPPMPDPSWFAGYARLLQQPTQIPFIRLLERPLVAYQIH